MSAFISASCSKDFPIGLNYLPMSKEFILGFVKLQHPLYFMEPSNVAKVSSKLVSSLCAFTFLRIIVYDLRTRLKMMIISDRILLQSLLFQGTFLRTSLVISANQFLKICTLLRSHFRGVVVFLIHSCSLFSGFSFPLFEVDVTYVPWLTLSPKAFNSLSS